MEILGAQQMFEFCKLSNILQWHKRWLTTSMHTLGQLLSIRYFKGSPFLQAPHTSPRRFPLPRQSCPKASSEALNPGVETGNGEAIKGRYSASERKQQLRAIRSSPRSTVRILILDPIVKLKLCARVDFISPYQHIRQQNNTSDSSIFQKAPM